MSFRQVGVCFVIFSFLGFSFSEIVEIDDGKIEGTSMTSRLGVNFHAFLAIPYVAPPTGNLRFEAPQPVVRWNGTLNATSYGPQCVQKLSYARPDFEMSEDCLQLNVFTKSLTELKPVIVFYHGGSYIMGNSRDRGGPQNLMDRDVVLVTVNYRLGALGFLATGTRESPGNAAMKDHVMSLRWIQKNIAKFGGDKNKVTITGLSAGAFSVSALMASPMATGLFHRVIAMSGAIISQNPTASDNLDYAISIAKALNCSVESVGIMLDCLRERDPIEIVSTDLADVPGCPGLIWRPTIEPDFGQDRFFTEDPFESFKSGRFVNVPIMIGRTEDEFADSVPTLLSNTERLNQLNENFEDTAPCIFSYDLGPKKTRELSKALRSAYLPFDNIDVRSFNALSNLFGDSLIGYGTHRLVHLISNQTDVYYYKFSYVSRFSVFYYPRDKPFGVNHLDDLQYPFWVDFLSPVINATGPEHFMIERITKIWEHFALNGNPNYDSTAISWPKHNSTHEYFMDFGNHMTEKNGMFLERYAVWNKVLANSGSSLKLLHSNILVMLFMFFR